MTDTHRPTAVAVAGSLTACLLLAACGNATHAAHTTSATRTGPAVPSTAANRSTPATQTAAAPTDATSIPATNAATTTSPPPVHGGANTACALITEKEVSSAIGADLGRGSPFSSHGATQCQFGSFETQLVLVNVLPTLGKLSYDRIVKDSRGRYRRIADIGDGALEHSDSHSDSIYFVKGDTLVLVGISTSTSPTTGGALILAKIAASQL